MKLKVKNIFTTKKKIKLLSNEEAILQPKEEILVGNYSDSLEVKNYIFNMLKKGFELSKVDDNFIIKK